MAIFHELRNECLIRELQRELNTDVLLFGFDGTTYFGNLQAVDDCRIAILTPAIEADTSNVEILSPGGELIEAEYARIDLWMLVGKATGIVNDPIDPPSSSSAEKERTDEENERQESHDLICQLRRSIGDDVIIGTLGGFLFEGTLAAVEDELAVLRVDDIFPPGTSSITESDVRSAVVNLEAITSVSGSTSCS